MNLLMLGTVLVLALVAAGAGWLLYTESGARWVWARATAALPEQLSAEKITGSLRNGLQVSGFRFHDATTDLRIDRAGFRINPDLVPTAINLEAVAVDGLQLQLTPAEGNAPSSEPPPELRDLLASLELPFLLRVRDLEVSDATLLSAEGEQQLALRSLRLDGALRRQLEIDRLQLQVGDRTLDLQAAMDLFDPYTVNLTATAKGIPGTDILQAARLDVTGDLDRLQLQLASESRQLTVTGSVDDIAGELRFDVVARAPELHWPLATDEPQVTLQKIELALAGTPDDYDLDLQTLVSAIGIDGLQASARGQGDLRGLRIDELTLASEPLQAELRGELVWADALSVSARLALKRLDPAHWQSAWPVGQPLSGELAANYSGTRVELLHVALQQRDDGAAIRGNGIVDVDGGVVDLTLSTESLQWPIAPETAEISSPAASLVVSGSPDAWQVAGEVALQAPELPPGRIVLNGAGDRESVHLTISEGQLLGGGINGTVAYNWSEAGRWSAELNIVDTRTTPLLPAWPGRLSASFATTGSPSPFAADLDIKSLTGELRSRPVAASGQLHIADSSIAVDDLQLRSGESSLALNGALHEQDGLRFLLDIRSLTDFLPGAAGQLNAEGMVRDGSTLPWLELQLEGRDLAYAGWSATTLKIGNEPSVENPLGLTVSASNLSQDQQLFDELAVSLQGSESMHRFEASAAAGERRLELALQGGLERGADLSGTSWQGTLAALGAHLAEDAQLALREPAEIAASGSVVDVGRLCVDVSSGGALCGHGARRQDGSYSAAVEMQTLPLDLLRYAGMSDLVFTQTIDGEVAVSSDRSQVLTAKGRIDISPGEIQNSYDDRLTLRTRTGFASFNLKDGQLLAGEVSLQFSDAAEIRGRFDVADVAAGTGSSISGSLQASVRDIGVGARIVPQIDDAGGSLDADLRVAGTLAAPEFSGDLSIQNGFFAYDPLGLRLDDVQLASSIRPGNRLEIESTFRVGEGRARLTSSADYLRGSSPGLELSLKGENLQLVDLEDLSVAADPDLKLGLRDNSVSINGRLGIPSARLASVNFIAGGVGESDDVVFVGEEQPVVDEGQETGTVLNFDGSVLLELGNDIVIDLDVAEARLNGQSEFTWQGPALPMANGAFELSGKFEAYGQLLEITEGSIRFPNVPADSPLLRIRAEREIFGNSQVRRAGVLVSGSALQPQVEVYTNPATTQDRALTLLVTGSDFNYEQGVGAVDVGTYIAPKLYASYGIGLFDKENVISVRYDLAKGFGIKATSGKTSSGIDISYTISK